MNAPHLSALPLAAALLGLAPLATEAGVLISGTVLPLGGSYRYEFSVENTDPADYLVVSFTDAPLADALIGPSLAAPAGFLTSYDSGLGFLDLLGDLELFAAGTTQGTFAFESLAPPNQAFTTVTALDDTLTEVTGEARWQVIPEPAAVGTVLGLGLLAVGFLRHRKPD